MLKKKILCAVLTTLLVLVPCVSTWANASSTGSFSSSAQEITQMNTEALNMVLEGKGSEINSIPKIKAFQDKLNSNSDIMKKYRSNIDALNSNKKPVRTIDTLINNENSKILVYQDGSFAVATVKMVRSDTKKAADDTANATATTESAILVAGSPLQAGQRFWTSNYNGYGLWDTTINYDVYSSFLLDHLSLGAAIDIEQANDFIEIYYWTTTGSYANLPDTLTGTNMQLLSNFNNDAIIQGLYYLNFKANILQLEFTRTAGSSSFTVNGYFAPYPEGGSPQHTNVPLYCQLNWFAPGSNLCWATSAAMIISHFLGDTVNREYTIAKYLYGTTDYNKPAQLYEAANAIHRYVPTVWPSWYGSPISYSQVSNEINANHPILTQIAWTTGGSHAEVITGYNNSGNYIYYNDPWYGQEFCTLYSSYVSNNSFTWVCGYTTPQY